MSKVTIGPRAYLSNAAQTPGEANGKLGHNSEEIRIANPVGGARSSLADGDYEARAQVAKRISAFAPSTRLFTSHF
jgi:hypothetical protein